MERLRAQRDEINEAMEDLLGIVTVAEAELAEFEGERQAAG
ncbi:MAG: hypothetical protein ACPGGK_02170 [Pikeienuella sp.]